jgi:hypothetical protein
MYLEYTIVGQSRCGGGLNMRIIRYTVFWCICGGPFFGVHVCARTVNGDGLRFCAPHIFCPLVGWGGDLSAWTVKKGDLKVSVA